MFTFCPACYTIYQLSAAERAQADGQVRCGGCGEVFDAEAWLFADLAALHDARQLLRDTPVAAPDAPPALETADTRTEVEADPAAVSSAAPPPDLLIPELAQLRGPSREALIWFLPALVLVLLLAGQVLHAQRGPLAADPSLRPWLERYCETVACRLPPWHEPDALHIVQRQVVQHPRNPQALQIFLTFINEADFAQPFPLLSLQFSDLTGRVRAARRFTPLEYLPFTSDEEMISAGLMLAGETLSVKLEVFDPGADAASFQFDFY